MNVILISFGLPYNLGGEAILLAYYISTNDINAHGFLVYVLNISFLICENTIIESRNTFFFLRTHFPIKTY